MQPTQRRSEVLDDEPRPTATVPTGGYRRRTRFKGERGYVLIMSALLMLPLLAFAGFAVDIGYWYTHANRMQRAADAAALAGVVWMPNDEKAETVALETAKANGFDDADPDIVVSVTPVGNRRLEVYIHDLSVEMYLSSLFIDQVDIERQALAEYVQAVPMGSPDNVLGNDPERVGVAGYNQPFYWLNISAPRSLKVNGDRYTSNLCSHSSYQSGCSANTSSGQNLDYSTYGYFYRMNVDARPASGDLNLQVFDPAFTNVGNNCSTTESSNLISTSASNYATQISSLVAKGLTDASSRYIYSNQAPDKRWCAADTNFNNSAPPYLETTYIVRQPDNTPFDNFDNPIVGNCVKTFGAYNSNVYDLLMNDANQGPENMRFRDHFRRWTTVCTVPWAQIIPGEYLVQVTSTADLSNVPSSATTYDPAVNTYGHNKFSMRAGFGAAYSANWATAVNVFADGRLPIYVNQAVGTPTNFYLARIVPEYAGQLLELELFDVADGSTASLTIVPPSDLTGSPIAGCTFIRDAQPPVVTASATCTASNLTSSNYNGRTLTAQIPLPDNYGCDAGSDYGCWFRINLDFGASGTPVDQTTWSARVRGDPVRLVE